MTNTSSIPTYNQFRKAGFNVNISHHRRLKIVHMDSNKKIVSFIGVHPMWFVDTPSAVGVMFWELIPRGGRTEVTATHVESGVSFYASSRCRDDEDYNKKTGVSECLKRIMDLMAIFDWKENTNLCGIFEV